MEVARTAIQLWTPAPFQWLRNTFLLPYIIEVYSYLLEHLIHPGKQK